MMSYEQARERQHCLMVARDADLAGRPEDARKVRAGAPHRVWDHAPATRPCRSCQIGPDARACTACQGTGRLSGTGIEIGSERRVTMINPTEKGACDGHAFVLWFGYEYLHVYTGNRHHEPSLEDALEMCAGWLADHAPGLIMPEGDEHLEELRKEACEDAGLAWPMPAGLADHENQKYWDAFESAEADLTRTESGYLTSYEWGISLEDPTVEELHAFVWGL